MEDMRKVFKAKASALVDGWSADIFSFIMDNIDEETTYQYFTIKNDEEESFIGLQDILDIPTGSNDNDVPNHQEETKQIYYLTFKNEENIQFKNDEESIISGTGTQQIVTTEDSNSCSSNSQNHTSILESNNINLITLEDGRMFMTTNLNLETTDAVQSPLVDVDSLVQPSVISLEDKTESINNLQIISNNNEDIIGEQIITEDNSEEANYQLIQLTDGTQALIKIYRLKTHNQRKNDPTVPEKLEADEVEEDLEPPKKPKKFRCFYEGCTKCYATSYHLTVHMRSHTDCRPYECTMDGCDKKFSTNYSLKAHVRTHTGEKPYGCTVCGKQFKTSGDLQKHVRIHTGEKPFLCPIAGCGKSFTTSNIRKVHVRSHTGERPYSCPYPICGKAFTSSTNYKNHLRIHSGEKPYACSVEGCGKRFTEYSSLYKHNAVHLPVRPHVCVFCGQKFKQESALNCHKRLKHNVVVTRDGTEIIVKLE